MSAALKTICQAPTAEAGEAALDAFEAGPWGQKYPGVVRSWRSAWDRVVPFFAFSEPIRRAAYATNAIESLNSTVRRRRQGARPLPRRPRRREAGRSWRCATSRPSGATRQRTGTPPASSSRSASATGSRWWSRRQGRPGDRRRQHLPPPRLHVHRPRRPAPPASPRSSPRPPRAAAGSPPGSSSTNPARSPFAAPSASSTLRCPDAPPADARSDRSPRRRSGPSPPEPRPAPSPSATAPDPRAASDPRTRRTPARSPPRSPSDPPPRPRSRPRRPMSSSASRIR